MVNRDDDDWDRRRFTRRAMIAGGLQAAAFAAVAARVYQLQVVDGRRLRVLADGNRISERPLLPLRGQILDRSGRVLATNIERFRVWIRPWDRSRLRPALQKLAPLLGLSDADIDAVVAKAKAAPRNRLLLVRSDVDFPTIAQIGLRAPDLHGVETDVVFDRAYAYGAATGHVVGHTGSIERPAMDDDAFLRTPGARVGKTGVELGLDRDLRGEPGATQVEVDARGDTVRAIAETSPVPGGTVTLTIDATLQQRVLARLSTETRAAAVALDVETGEVAVMVSVPSYDPNALTVDFDEAAFARLEQDPHKPLVNRAIAGLYPPGSTFKMVTALAALEAGATTTRETVTCKGAFAFAGETFRCWKRGGHGAVDLTGAIRQSCDVYFYELAERIGVDRIAAMAKVLGLGQTYACGLGGQKDGLIPTTGWKQAVKGQRWLRGETARWCRRW
jgi:penicillin-binding protein 2